MTPRASRTPGHVFRRTRSGSFPRSLFWGAGLVLVGAFNASIWAQLPQTELTSIYPPGAKQGMTLDVSVGGGNQDDLTGLVFSHPGITAAQKMTPPAEFYRDPTPQNNAFTVTVAADVPAGVYEARAVGRFGVSNPRAFVVGTLPEVVDDATNQSLATAKEIALGTVVNGMADANAVNYFKLTLSAGQKVIVECAAEELDSRMKPTLLILDPNGKELVRNRVGLRKDAILEFTSPAAGPIVIAVFDHIFGGGGEYFYRLAIHDGPHIEYVFPPAGQPGSNGSYVVYGRNLPGGQPAPGLSVEGQPLQQVATTIQLPDEATSKNSLGVGAYLSPAGVLLDSTEFRIANSNAISVGFARDPASLEQEPNNDSSHSQVVTVPCEVAGQFYPQRDVDWFQFDAKKGDIYWVDVISHRLGLRTDPVMVLQRVVKNDKGEETPAEIALVDDPGDRNGRIGSDFDYSTDDPAYRFVVPEDGLYRLKVRDANGAARNDPRFIYRLQIRREQPDFRLVALSRQNKEADGNRVSTFAPVLRRGGTTLIQVDVVRQEGFAGNVEVVVEGLPEGIRCDGAMLSDAMNTAWLVLAATESAPAWTGPIRIVGKARLGDQEVVRQARFVSVVWGTANRGQTPAAFRVSRDLTLSLTDKELYPALAQVGDGAVLETSRGGKLDVPVKLTRRLGFAEAVKLVATGMPGEIKPADIDIPGDKSDGTLAIQITNSNARPGLYTFYLRSDTKVKIPRNPDAVVRAQAEQKVIDEAVAQITAEMQQATADRDATVAAATQAADALAKAQAAQQNVEETQKKAQESEQSKAAADAKFKEVEAKQARVQAAKQAADKKVADVQAANQPADINFAIFSTPIRLRIVETPLQLSVTAPPAVKAGGTAEIPIGIQRLYGFAEQVELSCELPNGVTGLTVPNFALPKEQVEGKLALTVDGQATPGDHTLTIRAKAKFNDVEVQTVQAVAVKVEAAQ